MTDLRPNDHPEQGLWTRWRSWRDAFPGLILFDAIRPATWLTLLLIGSLAYWGCVLASAVLDQLAGRNEATVVAPLPLQIADDSSVFNASPLLAAVVTPPFRPDREAVDTFLSPAYAVIAQSAETLFGLPPLARPRRGGVWWMLLHRVVHLTIWAIPAGMVLHYSVSTIAGRERAGFGATGLGAAKRFFSLIAVALIPLLAVGIASLFFLIPGWISRASDAGIVIAEVLGFLAIPVALAAGLLAFGSLFAVPIGWAAVMVEPDGDAFDAISRGYEYAYRRPFHLIGYVLLAGLISRVLLFFAHGICFTALILSQRFFLLASGSDRSLAGIEVLHAYVRQLPSVFAALLFWALAGGVYLLMRHATNGQEVEEVDESLVNSGSMR